MERQRFDAGLSTAGAAAINCGSSEGLKRIFQCADPTSLSGSNQEQRAFDRVCLPQPAHHCPSPPGGGRRDLAALRGDISLFSEVTFL